MESKVAECITVLGTQATREEGQPHGRSRLYLESIGPYRTPSEFGILE